MQTPEEVERALAERLMPRGFSEKGGRELESLIDELAAGEDDQGEPRRRGWFWGAAAAAAVMVPVMWWPTKAPAEQLVAADVPGEEIELLSESIGVVAAEADEDLMSDADGSLMRAYHLSVVSEERFRDVETGHEVRVVRPSDELVLVPVSNF